MSHFFKGAYKYVHQETLTVISSYFMIAGLVKMRSSYKDFHGLNPVPKPEETWEQFLVKSPDLQKFVTEIKQQAAESDAAARQKLVDASEDHLL